MRFLTILLIMVLSSSTIAAVPFNMEDLPNSKLKTQLESLDEPARKRAMEWLNSFSFPANDIAKLNVDKNGGVFYVDDELPEEITQAELEADPTQAGISPEDAFKLHSKPGAANIVYVNFVGYTFSGTAWNANYSVNEYNAVPFDTDGNPSNFSTSERAIIGEVWHRIAEDFAGFDIDVTTEAPADFGPNIGHILITKDIDSNGTALPSQGAGGVAYLNVWGRSNYSYYQPALVYYNRLQSNPTYVAEASSHELGHNLGLAHDGSSSTTYYPGSGSGLNSWAPIMGSSYYANVTQWSKGEYSGANNTQDDLSIIDNKLSYKGDDHGNTKNSPTALLVDSNGFIASSNPEFDPLNVRSDNKGIIETNTDVDVFYFDAASGDINIIINPAWDAYTRTSRRGANLDIKATLFDDFGTVLVSDLMDNTNAVIATNVTSGRYYLEITGNGNDLSPYSDYASIGQYYISGSIIPGTIEPPPPPPVDNSVPLDPSNLLSIVSKTGKGKNKTITSAELTWVDNSNNETSFVVESCLEQTSGRGKNRVRTCDFTVYEIVGQNVTNLNIPTESSYNYRVKAVNENGDSGYTNEISI